MGIFAQIIGFFASCIRPSTTSNSANDETRRQLGPNITQPKQTRENSISNYVGKLDTNSSYTSTSIRTNNLKSRNTATTSVQRLQANSVQRYDSSTDYSKVNYDYTQYGIGDHSKSRMQPFLPYDYDNCELLPGAHSILCKDVKKDELLGSGSAHVKNIARVFQLKVPPDIHEIPHENIVIVDLSNIHPNCHRACKEVVQNLLCGLYYRRKASEAAAIRMTWKNKISTFSKLPGTTQQQLKSFRNFRDHYGNLMNSYNREACDELFKFFNFHREVCVVDLHGLLVADEEKLRLLKLDLSRQRGHNRKEVTDMINGFRAEGDEAIRKLEETLENFDLEEAILNNTPWLEIIVGAGHHSRNNQQRIRPKVEKLLRERKLTFAAVNKGSLVITFLAYSGSEPCFGEYYCEECNFCWKSNMSHIGKYQKCAHCKSNCWPVKQRERKT